MYGGGDRGPYTFKNAEELTRIENETTKTITNNTEWVNVKTVVREI